MTSQLQTNLSVLEDRVTGKNGSAILFGASQAGLRAQDVYERLKDGSLPNLATLTNLYASAPKGTSPSYALRVDLFVVPVNGNPRTPSVEMRCTDAALAASLAELVQGYIPSLGQVPALAADGEAVQMSYPIDMDRLGTGLVALVGDLRQVSPTASLSVTHRSADKALLSKVAYRVLSPIKVGEPQMYGANGHPR